MKSTRDGIFYNPTKNESLEKYSSAITLSDMEIFIFPELIYSLVLANIMSPIIWNWAREPWFKELEGLNEYRKILRIKQFIMDRFMFNLDLDTWGLTTKEAELNRFSSFMDQTTLSQSNALFGYEGDKYYFDIDIRRHFGLDKYTSQTIPHWKTETVEAMEAFKYKPNYSTGAGECVSLSTLYASALFVLAKVPLERIFLLATPLHSQNYIDVKEGILTNNRRIVTKAMWFNGTEISAKARRALENEQVTIVMNNSGYIHTVYPEATINQEHYRHFSKKLSNFLKTSLTFEILTNFLRQNDSLQKCFQIQHSCCGKPRYIEAEKAYHYEKSSKCRIGNQSQESLLHEIDEDEFYTEPVKERFILNELEEFFKKNKTLSVDDPQSLQKLKESMPHICYNVEQVFRDLMSFCKTQPRLPDPDKKEWYAAQPIVLDSSWSREEIIAALEKMRHEIPVVDLAFSSYRDLNLSPWKPFLKAAILRSPVCYENTRGLTMEQIAGILQSLANESIYDGNRLAQPDEVWNYQRGDGLEKAICFMSIARRRSASLSWGLKRTDKSVSVEVEGKTYTFQSSKEVSMPESADFDL